MRYFGPRWFFREENIAYARSEFVIVSPKDRPLQIESKNNVPPPEVKETGSLIVRRWRVDRSPASPVEPFGAPVSEFLPSVQVGWGADLKSSLRAMSDGVTDLTPNDPRIVRLLEEVKEREALGYAYEGADASFELLARRTLGAVPDYFDVTQFDVTVEQRYNAVGDRVTVAMAVVKVKVGDQNTISAAEGNGPVNALDQALRKDLGKYQKYIDGLSLSDFRVRILNSGTEAVTRVLIESEDENGDRWTTVGVSPNIIDASFQALMDSIVFKLVKSGAPV